MIDLEKMNQLTAYRKAITTYYLEQFRPSHYVKDEPDVSDHVWKASPVEIARARIAGIADAIEQSPPANVALAMFGKIDDAAYLNLYDEFTEVS